MGNIIVACFLLTHNVDGPGDSVMLSIVVAQSNHDHGLYDSTIFKDW